MNRLICVILLSVCIVSCSEPDRNQTESSDQDDIQLIAASELYAQCDDTLFAALYHHPLTRTLYDNPSEWAGQPINAFYDLLDNERKETLLLELHNLLSNPSNKDAATQLSQQLSNWCEAALIIEQAETELSREEILALLYESDRFNYLFLEFSDSPPFTDEEFSSIDKVASLSSSESSTVIATLITDLAFSRHDLFENEAGRLRQTIQ